MTIIYRIFEYYIKNEYDFTYNNNIDIYNKYIFYNEKDIDAFLIKNFTKKNKINSIILNLIVDDVTNNQILEYNNIIDYIKDINSLNK